MLANCLETACQLDSRCSLGASFVDHLASSSLNHVILEHGVYMYHYDYDISIIRLENIIIYQLLHPT